MVSMAGRGREWRTLRISDVAWQSKVRVDHFSYPTHSRWCLPDPHRRFLPQITLRRVTTTIPHLHVCLAKAIGLLYPYTVGLMVIVQVSYWYGYNRGSGRVGWSITEPTLTPVAYGATRYANLGLRGWTSEMLIKTASLSLLSLSSSLLLFLLPSFPHLLPATAKESAAALKLVSGSGQSPVAKRHLVKSASGEGNFSDNHIIHLFTIRLLTAQSAAPADGRQVQPHSLASPSRHHWVGRPLYLKFWAKLTPFFWKRRFSFDVRSSHVSRKTYRKKVQLTRCSQAPQRGLKNAKWPFFIKNLNIICDNFKTVRERMSVSINH